MADIVLRVPREWVAIANMSLISASLHASLVSAEQEKRGNIETAARAAARSAALRDIAAPLLSVLT
jgi:hypothetical protein